MKDEKIWKLSANGFMQYHECAEMLKERDRVKDNKEPGTNDVDIYNFTDGPTLVLGVNDDFGYVVGASTRVENCPYCGVWLVVEEI
jgi:hypothetical protein